MSRKAELLAPAGDMECLHYALLYGADAVYLGAREFGMRSSCRNFSVQELGQACALAHAQGKKVYLTLNTLPTNTEMRRMPAFVREAAAAGPGPDAFIVADLGVLDTVKTHAPGVEVHFSTQAGIANYASARAAHSLGAARVVLARELTLEDIAEVRAKTPCELELEVFVHGAMCMSVSGRCLLSQYLAGRDANRGMCTQSCRWKYSLVEETRPGQAFEIGEGEGGSYILNADDLCTLPFLDQIVRAGASSLKIEGRAKTFYYVASVTAAYRAALDAVPADAGCAYHCPDFALEEVEKTSHRPYSPGFFLGQAGATTSPECSGYIRRWQPVAVVQRTEGGRLHCMQRSKFSLGESLEALLPGGRTLPLCPSDMWDESGRPISATPHPKMLFSLPCPEGDDIPTGAILRKPMEK